MLDRRTFLTAGVTLVGLAGAGAALVATRRFDDVARLLGVDPPRYQDEADFALLDRVAEDEAGFVADLRSTALRHDDAALAELTRIADEHAEVVQAEVPVSGTELTTEEIRGRLDALIAARRVDVPQARSPEFAALLASLAAGHAQQRIVLNRVDLS